MGTVTKKVCDGCGKLGDVAMAEGIALELIPMPLGWKEVRLTVGDSVHGGDLHAPGCAKTWIDKIINDNWQPEPRTEPERDMPVVVR